MPNISCAVSHPADVARRDRTGNGNVQVMLFSDHLEIWNPGMLPPSLAFERLVSDMWVDVV
ncbi:MAG: ATP-binding protein [Methanoculleus sp.]|nr:ATP-binding protein [Methanoculleus sp.]